MANEDIPYTVGDYAIPEPEKRVNPDQPNKSILIDVQTYLNEAITEHNTFDVIDLSKSTTLTVEQQVAVQKIVVSHLRNIKAVIDDKVTEIK